MRAILPALLLLAACSEPPPPDDAPSTEPVTARAPLPDAETPYFILGPLGRSASAPRRSLASLDSAAQHRRRDSMLARMREEVARGFDPSRTVTLAETWRQADAIAHERLGPDSLVSHAAAVRMLDHHLLRGDLGDAKAEALGRYTQALLDHRSEEGALVLWALRRLDGRWDDRRIQNAAEAAADRLGAAYTRLARCVDCTIEEAVAGMWPAQGRTARPRLEEMAAVHRELRRMAAGDTPMP